MKPKMICPICRSNEIERGVEDYPYTESGLDNVVLGGITVYRCKGCNEVMPEIPRMDALHRIIAIHLIGKDELLSGKEIRFLRKEMGKQFGITPQR